MNLGVLKGIALMGLCMMLACGGGQKASTTQPAGNGGIVVIAGSPSNAGTSDGSSADARFNVPWGLAEDSSGNLFVSDSGSHTIRRISPSGEVTTIAGQSGQSGFKDGQGTEARFSTPKGLAIAPDGTMYVADFGNNAIRQISPSGAVTTLAGGTRGAQDGTGSNAQFNGPTGIGLDPYGWIYLADSGNNEVRLVSPTGQVMKVAGTLDPGSADSPWAQFSLPSAVAVDPSGNYYVADTGNATIRKISQGSPIAVTMAGFAGQTGKADGIGTFARFSGPSGLALDGTGNLFIADTGNSAIRELANGQTSTVAVLPFPPKGILLHPKGYLVVSAGCGIFRVPIQ